MVLYTHVKIIEWIHIRQIEHQENATECSKWLFYMVCLAREHSAMKYQNCLLCERPTFGL